MQFLTDHYFQIGSIHHQTGKPCQDYSLSGDGNMAACVVVSDGCSTGGYTDVGSRIQAFSLLSAIKNVGWPRGVSSADVARIVSWEKIKFMRGAQDSLGLSTSDMLATAVYAYIGQQGGFVHIEGDGAVVRKYRDGSLKATLYEWKGNMPFYPAYTRFDLEEFITAHGGDLNALRLTRTERVVEVDGNPGGPLVSEYTLRQGLFGIVEEIQKEELNDLEFLAVFTDGIAQVSGVDWLSVVKELMAFKNINGEFVKRRMIRALKDYEKEGLKPFDDMSMAVIRIAVTEEEGDDKLVEV